jgi:hypothetical protein
MKKGLIIVLVILGLLVTSAYVFFPASVTVTNDEKLYVNINSINRYLQAEDKWEKWWPGNILHDSLANKDAFEYKGYTYEITGYKYNAVVIQTEAKNFTIDGTIFLLPVNTDTVLAQWKYGLETNSNPINRIRLYLAQKKLNNNMKDILKKMKTFLEKTENVYGMHIEQIKVTDTILVTTKMSSQQYPSTAAIYGLIGGIKNYIAINHGKETNFPMLHVWEDSGFFHTTVAIPVDKKIPENNTYFIKRMVPGKILVSQVTGGISRTKEAIRQLGLFISDYNLASPAISFESLVTNRMEEPDTSKWVTKVYFPVM